MVWVIPGYHERDEPYCDDCQRTAELPTAPGKPVKDEQTLVHHVLELAIYTRHQPRKAWAAAPQEFLQCLQNRTVDQLMKRFCDAVCVRNHSVVCGYSACS